MNDPYPFLVLEKPCNDAINWVTSHVSEAGLQVKRTFDLQVARHGLAVCPCPHHGTYECDCQMVVLLVYGSESQPVSIVAHGNHNQTWFSIVDTAQQRANSRLERAIEEALVAENTLLKVHGSTPMPIQEP